MAKRSNEARKLAGLIGKHSDAPLEGSMAGDVQAVINALNLHKMSNDHDAFPHDWEAVQKFLATMFTSTILPLMPDTYDIGSDTSRYRKGFFSELSTIIFKKENVIIMDGQFLVTKMAGKLEVAVAAANSTIDFGRTMTTGDFLLFRSEGKMEYMKVGSIVTVGGTRYNVTRNLDGSGANDWGEGEPFAVLGSPGEGWLEMSAVDESRLRFSVWVQGSAYNNSTEIIRMGKLDGWQDETIQGHGIAIGSTEYKNYLIYTPDEGLKLIGAELYAGGGSVAIGVQGLRILTHRDGIVFLNEDGEVFGQLKSVESNGKSTLTLSAKSEGVNLFPDGQFSGALTDWTPSNANLISISSGKIGEWYSPPSSLFMTGAFSGVAVSVESPYVAVLPNTTYILRYYRKLKASTGSREMIVSMQKHNSAKTLTGTVTVETITGNKAIDWALKEIVFTTGVNDRFVRLRFNSSNLTALKNFSGYFDDVELRVLSDGDTSIELGTEGLIQAKGNLYVDGHIDSLNINKSPIADGIPLADPNGKLDSGWLADDLTKTITCKRTRTTAQSIAANQWVQLQLTGTFWNTDDMTTTAQSITIKTAGIYQLLGTVMMLATATGFVGLAIYKNGVLLAQVQSSQIAFATNLQVHAIENLAVNDVLTLRVYHQGSGAVNTNTTIPPSLTAVRIGAI